MSSGTYISLTGCARRILRVHVWACTRYTGAHTYTTLSRTVMHQPWGQIWYGTLAHRRHTDFWTPQWRMPLHLSQLAADVSGHKDSGFTFQWEAGNPYSRWLESRAAA